MTTARIPHGLTVVLTLGLSAALYLPAFGQPVINEEFDNATYKDLSTTADWETTPGQLQLPTDIPLDSATTLSGASSAVP